MMGSTHKMIGIFVGIVLAICGVLDREYTMLVMLFTVPVGAMFPDIDHNNTRIGRKRKEVVGLVKKILPVGFAGFVLAVIYSVWSGTEFLSLFPAVCVVLGFMFLLFVGSSEWGKKNFKFFTKHRGIMHTLLLPGLLLYVAVVWDLPVVIKQMLLGFTIGYLTHLVADCCTTEGCPILWPLTTGCVKIPLAVTNTKSEKVVAVLLCGVFAISLPLLYKVML